MKKIFTLMAVLLLASTASFAQRSFLSNYSASVNAGISGIGVSLSTVLHQNFNLRVGYEGALASYKYTVDDMGTVDYAGYGIPIPDLKLKAKLKGGGFHMLVDYNPFKQGMGAFHLTAGFYAGGNELVTVDGQFDRQLIEELYQLGLDPTDELSVEVGDAVVRADASGKVKAYAKVNSFKPYLGFGWGNAIPRGRVGFRFDMGVLFHGKPSIQSPNLQGKIADDDDIDSFNKLIGKVSVWPQMTFQVTYKIFKEDKFR